MVMSCMTAWCCNDSTLLASGESGQYLVPGQGDRTAFAYSFHLNFVAGINRCVMSNSPSQLPDAYTRQPGTDAYCCNSAVQAFKRSKPLLSPAEQGQGGHH